MKTKDAIEWAGGTQRLLAAKLGIKQPSVANWGEYPPLAQQLRIQALSGGALQCEHEILSLVEDAMKDGGC